MWLAVIGFFLVIVAGAERQCARLAPALRGVKAADAMSGFVETCPDWFAVERCVEDVALRAHHSTLVVTDFEGGPSGLLHLPRLARIPAEQRQTVRVRDVSNPLPHGTTCTPDDLLQDVLEDLRPGRGLPILVIDRRNLVGIIAVRVISRIVQRHALGGTEGR